MESNIIDVNDLGVTLRTLLAIADARLKVSGHKTYKVRYKHMIIGSVKVRHQQARAVQSECNSFSSNVECGLEKASSPFQASPN